MTEQQTPSSKPKSRSQRWTDAIGAASGAIAGMKGFIDDLENAISDLKSVQEEYEEWKDNLPENLSNSPVGEKLEEVCSLDIEGIPDAVRSALDEVEDKIGEAESVDLPRGFGKD